MLKMQMEFNKAAAHYDDTFTNTIVGRAQRNQVWKLLQSVVKKGNKVLELNAGTGEDALFFLKKKCEVTITDGATNMLNIAKQKVGTESLATFQLLNLKNTSQLDHLSNYELIFSNFGGLNCLSTDDINKLASALAKKMDVYGKIILVLMSKKCLWERLYYSWKGEKTKSNRRNTNMSMQVIVDGSSVTTFFYDPKEIIAQFSPYFNIVKTRPIGFFVPPSYLNNWLEKRKYLGKTLIVLDRLVSSFNGLSNYADHFYVEFNKK
jgi:hypothetical protein